MGRLITCSVASGHARLVRVPQRDVRPAALQALSRERVLRRRHVGAAACRRHGSPARSERARQRVARSTFDTGKISGVLAETLPFPVDRSVLERGQDRYRIFCTPCHGELGNGRGMIVLRGFNPPPSFHDDELRKKPVGHYFDVMTRGFGTMYSYASRIPAKDRWAIAAYIRALQLSQRASRRGASDRRSKPARGGRSMSVPSERGMMCGDELLLRLDRLQTRALAAGGGGLALSLAAWVLWPRSFFRGLPGGISLLAGHGAGLDRAR